MEDKPTWQLSHQPAAIGAVAGVTKQPKPLIEGHLLDSASVWVAACSQRRAAPEKGDVKADPDVEAGKAGEDVTVDGCIGYPPTTTSKEI
jgi:hypothetical protein